MSPLTIYLCAAYLIMAAVSHSDRELTDAEVWHVLTKSCLNIDIPMPKGWTFQGKKCDRDCVDLMKLGLSEAEINAYKRTR